MKKVVLDLVSKAKRKVIKTVCGFSGVESMLLDMKDKKLTVTGDIYPVHLVRKRRKRCRNGIVSVGPAKEEEKKKEESKKDDKKGNKRNYYPYMATCYHAGSAEEDLV